MIRITKSCVAMSIQDMGRSGYRWKGFSRSGAMDPASLAALNGIVGNDIGAAAIEMGPGRAEITVLEPCTIAFGGARRFGADWWSPIEAVRGDILRLSDAEDGMWSYIVLRGGVEAPVVMGSRSTNVREGIGDWLEDGNTIAADMRSITSMPAKDDAPPMQSSLIRVFGNIPGRWRVGTRMDRMGYLLENIGSPERKGKSGLPSEPLMPGCIQLLPSGNAIVAMAEASTIGGYEIAATVHSEDIRLIAQSRPGTEIHFTEIGI